jgi:cysteine synthase A
MKAVDNVLELIGNTPMIELSRVTEGLGSRVLVKLEYLNPSGSIKDRVALSMIEGAEKEGKLSPGYTIVESSTGNTGTSLAFVGAMKGYSVQIFETTPGKMGVEKRKLMESYGAEVKSLSPQDLESLEGGVAGAEVELPGRVLCLELERTNKKVWWARQFSNPYNVLAHHNTGTEILEQTDGNVDAYVASIGTGGTLMGVAQVLKREISDVKVVGIQPSSSKKKMIPGEPYPRSEIEGGIVADMLEEHGLIDEIVQLSDVEAVNMAHRLWKEEGIFAGISSGANVHVAIETAKKLGRGNTIVAVLHDSGDRYLTEEHYVT